MGMMREAIMMAMLRRMIKVEHRIADKHCMHPKKERTFSVKVKMVDRPGVKMGNSRQHKKTNEGSHNQGEVIQHYVLLAQRRF